MTTRDHLVHRLQELYAYERDVLPLIMEMQHTAGDERVCLVLRQMRDELRSELETLEQGINLLSAHVRQERSTMVPGLHEALSRFKHQLNPSQEQWAMHTVLVALTIVYDILGAYAGDHALASATGESDVVLLLEENRRKAQGTQRRLASSMTTLVAENGQHESRRAA
ncbi:MAG TPA: DUF892 family protein [Armatimonadota bacterium]|jgi:ferritin-like metal-binding protein YciE